MTGNTDGLFSGADEILAIIIVLMAAAYAGWRIYLAFSSKNDPCAGCQGCSLKGKIKEKQQCPSENKGKTDSIS